MVAQMVKNPPATQETQVQSLYQEDPLEKEMATHSRILAWRIPRTEEPGGLQCRSAAAESLPSCPTLCDPTDGSPQAPPSLGSSRQEHWSGLPFPQAQEKPGKTLGLAWGQQRSAWGDCRGHSSLFHPNALRPRPVSDPGRPGSQLPRSASSQKAEAPEGSDGAGLGTGQIGRAHV